MVPMYVQPLRLIGLTLLEHFKWKICFKLGRFSIGGPRA